MLIRSLRLSFSVWLAWASISTGVLWAQPDGATVQRATDARARSQSAVQRGTPQTFEVDPRWKADRFPDHAVCYCSPDEIAAICAKTLKNGQTPITSYAKPTDGSLRIVGTGHSFMAPGYKTLPLIAQAAGYRQQGLLTHTGGGITGSARYKWEQENGIFQFDGQPKPILLSSIAGAEWDAMMWGPYYNDQPEYYACWIHFCQKYNPDMKFYLSDAWPQLDQVRPLPKREAELTGKVVARVHQEKRDAFLPMLDSLNERFGDCVYVLPTSQALVLAVDYFHRGVLPGIDGIHKSVGGQERSLWRDRLGHLGPGLEALEGYVFYATLYGRSPELLDSDPRLPRSAGFPSEELDRTFRKIAWQAVITDPLSGVVDRDGNGVNDFRQ